MGPRKASDRLILVVEDEALLRLDAVNFLHDAGYATIEACNGADALAQIKRNPSVDLVFTDVNMPGEIDGLDLVARVNRRWPEIRIIVTSGKTPPSDRPIPARGCFISKPYTAQSIVHLVATAG